MRHRARDECKPGAVGRNPMYCTSNQLSYLVTIIFVFRVTRDFPVSKFGYISFVFCSSQNNVIAMIVNHFKARAWATVKEVVQRRVTLPTTLHFSLLFCLWPNYTKLARKFKKVYIERNQVSWLVGCIRFAIYSFSYFSCDLPMWPYLNALQRCA